MITFPQQASFDQVQPIIIEPNIYLCKITPMYNYMLHGNTKLGYFNQQKTGL